jgi:hypothetical protein
MNMVHRVQELALGYPEGRLELQLVGGYSDSRNYSEELFYNIMRKSLLSLMPWLLACSLLYVCDSVKFLKFCEVPNTFLT